MSDSDKNIAKDILIAALQRGNHAEGDCLSAEQIVNEAECLTEAFLVIFRAVESKKDNRIAADLLISVLQRGKHAKGACSSAKQVASEAEHLAKAFQVIFHAVESAQNSPSDRDPVRYM